MEYDIILIDATETPIERPKKQKHYYSGKKKKHTLKTQLVMDKRSQKIICTAFSNGKRHDFRLFKESKIHIHPDINALTDSAYLGLQKVHAKIQMPKKKVRKNHSLKKIRKITLSYLVSE
jgi:hypothetical protein